MEIEPLSSLYSQLPSEGWRRLKTFMMNVEVGFPSNLVTPFLPKEWRDDELGYAEWYRRNITFTGISDIDAVETSEAEKFGPFSIRLPFSRRRESVEEYFSQSEGIDNDILRNSFEMMRRWLPKHSLSPDPLSTSYGAMPKDSNLGLPWFTRDKSKAREYFVRAKYVDGSGYKEDIFPSVLGWRGQPNGTEEPKQRIVWMTDHVQTIIGLSVQAPILRALRIRDEFAAWNELSVVDRVITGIIDAKPSEDVISIDFSGFDRSLVRLLIHMSFELLRYWFAQSAKRRIDWLEDQMLTVALVDPDGVLHGRVGGMPSGDALTNLIDSLSQLLGMYSITSHRTVLGDDGVYRLLGGMTLDELAQYWSEDYGMKISTSKGSSNPDSVSYLQRLHLRGYRVHGLCVGVRSLTRTWNGACHLERGTKDLEPEFFSARTIMQLENAKWHPAFRRAVRYYASIDRYAQMFDPIEIFRRAGGVRKVESVLGLTGFKFGSELPSEGLNEFATVKELRLIRSGAS